MKLATCYRCGKQYIRNSGVQKYCGNRKTKSSCSYKRWVEIAYECQRRRYGTETYKLKRIRNRKVFKTKYPHYWKDYYAKRKDKSLVQEKSR